MKRTQNLTVWFSREELQLISDFKAKHNARGLASVVRLGTLRLLGNKKSKLEKPFVVDMSKPLRCSRHGNTMDFGQYMKHGSLLKRCRICMRASASARRAIARIRTAPQSVTSRATRDILDGSTSPLAWNN